MPGDDWQKFANSAALYGFMYGHPGQEAPVHGGRVRADARVEPRHEPRLAPSRSGPYHRGLQNLIRDLNRVYRTEPRSIRSTSSRPASSGWTAPTPIRAWSPSSGGRATPATSSWSRVTSRPYPGTAIASACPPTGSIASCSTPTPRTTAGATWGTGAVSGRSAGPGPASRGPWYSPFPRSPW